MSHFTLVPPHPGRAEASPQPLADSYDAVLVGVQAGADWAWTLLYRSIAPEVLAFLQAGGDAHPVDTLGEVLVEVARGVRTFGGDEAGLRTWVFAIAHRRLSSKRRPGPRDLSGPAAGPSLRPEARAVLEALSEDERDAVLLCTIAGVGAAELAMIMRIPFGSAVSLYGNGRTTLDISPALRSRVLHDPWRTGRVAPPPGASSGAGGFLLALQAVPAISAAVEHHQVVGAARAAISGSTAPPAEQPAFRRLRPIARSA